MNMQGRTEDISSLIDSFINGTISGDDASRLDHIRQQNPDINAFVNNELAMKSMIVESELASFRSQLNDAARNHKSQTKHRQLAYVGSAFIAASVILVFWNTIFVSHHDLNQRANVSRDNATTQPQASATHDDDEIIAADIKSVIQLQLSDNSPYEKFRESLTKQDSVETVYIPKVHDTILANSIVNIDDENIALQNTTWSASENTSTHFSDDTPCPESQQILSLRVKKSTAKGYDGEITILNGKPGWSYTVNDDRTTPSLSIPHLDAGLYHIKAIDTNSCIAAEGMAEISRSKCPVSSEYSFNPVLDGSIVLDVERSDVRTISIINKSHQTLRHLDGIEWDGFDTRGVAPPVGLYKAIITMKDGETCFADITLVK